MKPRTITIEPVLNGFIVTADCQRVVFQSRASMLASLGEYYDNPAATEKSFLANAVNQTLPLGGGENEAAMPQARQAEAARQLVAERDHTNRIR